MSSLDQIKALDVLKYDCDVPLPSPQDDAYFKVLSEIAKFPPEQLGLDFSGASIDLVDTVRFFGGRMASLGVREKNVERIRIGLFTLVLASIAESSDLRETLLDVPLHLRSIEILGLKAEDVIAQVPVVIAPRGRATLLEDFMRRSPEDRSIKAMGFKETGTATGLVYEQTLLKSRPKM